MAASHLPVRAGNIHGCCLNLIEKVSSCWIPPESKGRLKGRRISYHSSGRVVFSKPSGVRGIITVEGGDFVHFAIQIERVVVTA